MTTQPRISVVIPCYNAARFLRETLASVLRQTYPAFEVIVVDDGSTDESASIAASYGPPVRVIRQENQGESVARNRGISAAEGDWVALLDADDLWEPQKLERQVEVALGLPTSYACVYNDFYMFDETKKYPVEARPEYHTQPDARVCLLLDWCVSISTPLIRREHFRTVCFPEAIRYGEDPIFFAQLRDQGRFFRIPEGLTGLRISASQQTRTRDFHIHKMRSLFYWFNENADRYSPAERDYVHGRIRDEIVAPHDAAYWRRQLDLVQEYRVLFAELFGEGAVPPPMFRRRLFPRPIYWVKDWTARKSQWIPRRSQLRRAIGKTKRVLLGVPD